MKNKKRTILVVLALLLIPTTVYAMINWEGTENVENIKDNLELIQIKMDTLKEDSGSKDQTIREIEILLEQETALREQKERELQDKQKEIHNKIDEINQKIAENNKLIEKNNKLKEKADQVDGLKAEVERLKNDNAVLTTDNNALRKQLDQALKDVKEIEAITNEMIQ